MTTETLALSDFLLARIAEDEEWLAVPTAKRMVRGTVYQEPIRRLPDYIARDRARWAAECAAKRRIVEECRYYLTHSDPTSRAGWLAGYVLRRLALIYADHPDYQPEWRE